MIRQLARLALRLLLDVAPRREAAADEARDVPLAFDEDRQLRRVSKAHLARHRLQSIAEAAASPAALQIHGSGDARDDARGIEGRQLRRGEHLPMGARHVAQHDRVQAEGSKVELREGRDAFKVARAAEDPRLEVAKSEDVVRRERHRERAAHAGHYPLQAVQRPPDLGWKALPIAVMPAQSLLECHQVEEIAIREQPLSVGIEERQRLDRLG